MIPGEKIVLKRLVHSLDFNPTYQSINFLHYTYISLTYLKNSRCVCRGGRLCVLNSLELKLEVAVNWGNWK